MKNLVISKLDGNKHSSRHRSSGDRVSTKHQQQSPLLRVESITEKVVKSSACDGSMPFSVRRHSSIGDDEIGVHSSSSSKCEKLVIESSRQPRNSVLKNKELGCDGVEKVEARKNGLVLEEKGSRSMKISVPIRKKKSLMKNDKDNSAMEVTVEKKKTLVLVKEEVEEEDREQIGVMVAEPEPEEEEEGKKKMGFMAVKEEVEEEEERKDIVGAMSDAKTWNFRPRNPIRRSLNLNGNNFGVSRLMVTPKCPPNPTKKPDVVEKKKKESVKDNNSQKRCLTASLTKDEFKEDCIRWAQVGLKPPKKHIKRPKCVQKQVNNVCLGAYLDSVPVTLDSYNVSKKDVGQM